MQIHRQFSKISTFKHIYSPNGEMETWDCEIIPEHCKEYEFYIRCVVRFYVMNLLNDEDVLNYYFAWFVKQVLMRGHKF